VTGIEAVDQLDRTLVCSLTERQIRHGVRRRVRELESAIREYLVPCNQSPKPFVWVETAGEILAPAFSKLQIQDFITR
jgi:hypothetical protein